MAFVIVCSKMLRTGPSRTCSVLQGVHDRMYLNDFLHGALLETTNHYFHLCSVLQEMLQEDRLTLLSSKYRSPTSGCIRPKVTSRIAIAIGCMRGILDAFLKWIQSFTLKAFEWLVAIPQCI